MHLDNLSQIALPNMWLIIDKALLSAGGCNVS